MQVSVYAPMTLETQTCCVCGVVWGMAENHLEQRRADGQNYYCPNGHALHFGEGALKKLERDLQRERQQHDQTRAARADAEKRLAGAGAEAARLAARTANGVCPCCNRHFANLHAHMEGQHPGYAGRMAAVLAYLKEHPRSGPKAIARGTGIPLGSLYPLLKKGLREGRLVRRGNGDWSAAAERPPA